MLAGVGIARGCVNEAAYSLNPWTCSSVFRDSRCWAQSARDTMALYAASRSCVRARSRMARITVARSACLER